MGDQLSHLEERTQADHRSNGVWKRIEERIANLYDKTMNSPHRVWKGLEWRLAGLKSAKYSQILHRLALLYRPRLRRTIFIGITGSAGKTTTKDLVASILEHHFSRGKKGAGTLNGPDEVARLVLQTRPSDAYCVTEIAVTNDGDLNLQIALFRPTVGVVTNIGGDHVSAYGSLDGIAAEKSKLVKSLPASGIAVLNADDPRVIAMQSQCAGRTITYGMSEHAMLRGDAVQSAWPDRLSFTVTWNGQSVRVQTQLCGNHWVPVVLAALATGVALGVPLDVAAAAVVDVKPYEGRMSPVELGDGVTFMRDDWKGPFWTIAPTFDFMRQARAARKIIVMGSISDYQGDSTRRYVEIGQLALTVAHCVVFVGPRASASLRAKRDANDPLFAFPSLRNASTFLQGYLRPGDLVLLKGSTRADHLDRLLLGRTGNVACWRAACGRNHFCDECSFVHVVSDPEPKQSTTHASPSKPESFPERVALSVTQPTEIVIGLGNPGDRYEGTPHNVGHCVVDMLAQRLNGSWIRVGDSAMVARTQWMGRPVWLMKLLTPINDAGPTLLPLSQECGFSVKDCIFVHDDLDLPIGAIRARPRGSDGGHRGVQSIIEAFQDDKFRRVKIGIGKPTAKQSIIDYVLTPFPPEQRAAVDAGNQVAADRVISLIQEFSVSKAA